MLTAPAPALAQPDAVTTQVPVNAVRPRSAAGSGPGFPYHLPSLCYIEVHDGGEVTCGAGLDAFRRVQAGRSRLYAVWPGQHRSEVYIIDDLAAYARAAGLLPGRACAGLARHPHDVRWAITAGQPAPGGYVTVLVRLGCGCTLSPGNLGVFAAHMLAQLGWDIARTAGLSRHGGTCRPRVRRSSLALQARS